MRLAKWLLAITLLVSSGVSRADTWVEVHYGASDVSEYSIFGLELNYAEKDKIYTLGVAENTACLLWCLDDVFYAEWYASYGIRKPLNEYFTATGQIGVSSFREADFGCDEVCDQTVLGIPIDIGLMGAAKYAGLGLNLRVSLNSVETTATLTFTAALGKIK